MKYCEILEVLEILEIWGNLGNLGKSWKKLEILEILEKLGNLARKINFLAFGVNYKSMKHNASAFMTCKQASGVKDIIPEGR